MTCLVHGLATVLLLSLGAAAQTRPDFSGTWTLDETRSVSPTHDSFVGPVVWVVKQSPKELVVTISRGPKTFTLTYVLYDKPPVGSGSENAPAYRAYWEDNRLVTETAQNIQGQTVTTREVRSLEPGGREMIVERLVRVEHGYTLRGAQSYNTAKDIFVRTSP